MNITPPQLARLQVLYSQFQKKSLDTDAGRAARIAWACEQTGRTVASFSDLHEIEARRMIDGLQQLLGTKAPNQSPRRERTPEQRRQMGTAGRRDGDPRVTILAASSDLAMIERDRHALDWSEARLEAFLRSKKSPTQGRTTLLTLTEVNRVHWTLQRFIRAAKKAS